MLIPNVCLSLLSIFSIFLTLTPHTAGAPGLSLQTTDTFGDTVASRVIEVLAAGRPSLSLQSSVLAKSSYQAANSTRWSTSLQSTQSFSLSDVPITVGETSASNVIEGPAALESSQSLQSFVSVQSYTAVIDISLPTSLQSTQSVHVSGVTNTAADWLTSTVAGVADMPQQSASSAVTGASLQSSFDATNSAQSTTISIPSPVSMSSVQNLGLNRTLTPLPNVATVIIDGTSQVIYKQTFINLQSITAAENITTAFTQYSSQTTSNAILPVVAPVAAPVAVVVDAGGIWYRIRLIGPPIGPPELLKLTIGGGRPLFCELFSFLCPGTAPLSPPGPPDPPDLPGPLGNVQTPPNPADDLEPESEKASQSRGEPTNMPSSTQISTIKSTYSAQSQTTRPTTPTQNSTTRSASSTQPLISFNWVTQTPSPDPLFLTTSENFSAMASYLQAQFTSMGIAFDQEDAMAGVGPVNGTSAATAPAFSAGKETDIPATATNGADAVAAAAAEITAELAQLLASRVSMSSTANLASNSAASSSAASGSAAALAASTVSATTNEPPSCSPTQPPSTTPPTKESPILILACTLS